jgi:hypothetical protein
MTIPFEERNMNLPTGLSLEQEFNLRSYEQQIRNMSQEQAQEFLLEVLRQMMIKDNMIKQLMLNQI